MHALKTVFMVVLEIGVILWRTFLTLFETYYSRTTRTTDSIVIAGFFIWTLFATLLGNPKTTDSIVTVCFFGKSAVTEILSIAVESFKY